MVVTRVEGRGMSGNGGVTLRARRGRREGGDSYELARLGDEGRHGRVAGAWCEGEGANGEAFIARWRPWEQWRSVKLVVRGRRGGGREGSTPCDSKVEGWAWVRRRHGGLGVLLAQGRELAWLDATWRRRRRGGVGLRGAARCWQHGADTRIKCVTWWR